MILFNVRLLSELPLVTELARRFVAQGEPVAFCSESNAPDASTAIQAIAAELSARCFMMETLTEDASRRRAASPVRRLKGLASRAVSKVITQGPLQPPTPLEQQFIDEFSAQHAGATTILRESRADVVIVTQDGMSGNAPLIGAAGTLGIPVVDCPYGFGTTRDFDDYVEEKHREGSLTMAEGELAGRIKRQCAQWIRQSQFGDVLMYPAEYILARERAGLSLPLPWVIHGGAADLLAAESPAMRDHYLAEGIAPEKIRLTGTVYCDVMSEQLRSSGEAASAYEHAQKIRRGVTSVLVSLPPSLHGIRARLSEFESYEAGCSAIAELFRNRANVSAVVSLHPNAPAEQRRFVESLGLEVAGDWILRLIPSCDVFFTTFSSTIRWAIACGKPVLNYNMYSYNNHDYDAVEGVFTHQQLREIAAVFDRLIDDTAYAAVAARQKAAGASWGMMDGRNFERIHGAVMALRQSHSVEARS